MARPEESEIKDVKLLFFIYDEHGNGLYAGSLDGTVDGNHLAKTGKISVTIPGSGSIDNPHGLRCIGTCQCFGLFFRNGLGCLLCRTD